jgi:cytochrome P450
MTVHTTAVPIVKGLPVLGSATRLLRDTLRSICTLRAQGGVATIRVGAPTLFVVVDPRLVRQMLVDKAHPFDKGRQFEKLRLWWGDGLSTSEGTCHLRQRRLMQPAFKARTTTERKVAVSGVTAGHRGVLGVRFSPHHRRAHPGHAALTSIDASTFSTTATFSCGRT